MRRAPPPRYPRPDVLVAIMNNRHDFAIAGREHWYRIPCRSAPQALDSARWLAFYHTSDFGAAKWAVHFVARVHGIDRVLRRDLLPDEPNHSRADEPYFRVRIGPLEQLDHPVASARGRRVVFIPTTLTKLRAAHELNDLFHESPLEDRLWYALRAEEVSVERQYYVAESGTTYCLDFAVFCLRGNLDVECDGDTWHLRPETVVEDNARNNFLARLGWHVLRFSSRELTEPRVASTVGQIRATAERLGGIELPGRAIRHLRHPEPAIDQLRLW